MLSHLVSHMRHTTTAQGTSARDCTLWLPLVPCSSNAPSTSKDAISKFCLKHAKMGDNDDDDDDDDSAAAQSRVEARITVMSRREWEKRRGGERSLRNTAERMEHGVPGWSSMMSMSVCEEKKEAIDKK